MKSTKRAAIKKALQIAIPWYLDKRFHKATPFVVCLFMVANVVNIGLSFAGVWQGFFPNVADLKQSSNVLEQLLFFLLQPFQHANFWMMAVLSGVAILTQILVLIGKLKEIPSLYKPYLIYMSAQFFVWIMFGICLLWHSLSLSSRIIDSEVHGNDKDIIIFFSYMGIMFISILSCVVGGAIFVIGFFGVNRSRKYLQGKTKIIKKPPQLLKRL